MTVQCIAEKHTSACKYNDLSDRPVNNNKPITNFGCRDYPSTHQQQSKKRLKTSNNNTLMFFSPLTTFFFFLIFQLKSSTRLNGEIYYMTLDPTITSIDCVEFVFT